MKKNANILEYVEKYKYKYGISYATQNSNFVKKMCLALNLLIIYVAVWFALLDLGVLFNAQNVNDSFFAAIKGHQNEKDFYTLLACFALLVVILLLAQKCKLFFAAIIPVLATAIFSVSNCTKTNGGLEYLYSFYLVAIPIGIAIVLAAIVVFILIRAIIKTNKLYDMLVEGLYKQYGTRDGEKLSEDEWNEFLSNYNPHKPTI